MKEFMGFKRLTYDTNAPSDKIILIASILSDNAIDGKFVSASFPISDLCKLGFTSRDYGDAFSYNA